ncbi:MAG: type II toxin-antitoxin system PemK/MazF family toxin [Gemmatimonadaceae bacterium]
MRRGTAVWVNLEDAHPPELGKTRPAVIVSNTEQNSALDSVVVIPLSSRAPAIWPLRLAVSPIGKLARSFAITPGIRQVASRRLMRAEGVVSDVVMDELSEALAAYLGD